MLSAVLVTTGRASARVANPRCARRLYKSFDQRPVAGEWRNLYPGRLAAVIPTSKVHGLLRKRFLQKDRLFCCGVGAALLGERHRGGMAQRSRIRLIGGHQVPLGVDMEAHRFRHSRTKVPSEPAGPNLGVRGQSPRSGLADEMANVMQQRRKNKCLFGPRLSGDSCRLQRMIQHGDLLAVAMVGALLEQTHDVINNLLHGQIVGSAAPRRWLRNADPHLPAQASIGEADIVRTCLPSSPSQPGVCGLRPAR